ncbi:hypothetical protein P691DRAFT_644909, partial [Macrolepiota fuliginosa MF-IS2]
STPPIFADGDKFDGTNWVAWSRLIHIAAEVQGISGYLNGTIPQPSPIPALTVTTPAAAPATGVAPATTTAMTILPTDTPWDSATPSAGEWKVRNVWSKSLLVFNTCNPVGLGINISGTAEGAWKSYLDQ